MQNAYVSLLRSALAILPIEPSGPGAPTFRIWPARMFVSRSNSARIHSRMRSSRTAVVLRSAGMRSHSFNASRIGPEAFGGMIPPIATRSFMSVVSDTRQPSPGLPSVSAAGTRASVKNTSLNSASPVIWRSGRTSTPGACMSTTIAVSPACFTASGSVRTTSRPKRDTCASVVHTFCAFTSHSSPSRTALPLSPAKSEPEPGSENNWHHTSSPVKSGRR